jgi:hypothetical protein
MITKYAKMPTDEFLQMLTDKRAMSPIIDELCTRLEVEDAIDKETNMRVSCPACDAPLLVDLDQQNNLFTVSYDADSNL